MRYYLLFIFLSMVNTQIVIAQIKSRERAFIRNNRAVIMDDRTAIMIASANRDTIPISRYKYFRVDDDKYKRYLNTFINKDSVKLLKASVTDWSDFDKAFENLKKSLRKNVYNNVENYVDTVTDFKELKLLNPKFLPNTAKVCLRQLIFNIGLVNQLLAKQLDKEDLTLLAAILKNIDKLVSDYIAPVGSIMMIHELGLTNVRLRVYGKDRTELNNARCYFVSNHTCRDIACMTCLPSMDPCDGKNINAIVSNSEISYDCANPGGIKIGFGHYHIFVMSNNKIIYSELRHIDENSIPAAANNEINIFLQ